MATLRPADAKSRVMSLDAFRGFVILAMTFVNYVGAITGVPAWLQHVDGNVDGYTFVDLVFPGFLFMVGMSIPLSFERRLAARSAWQPMLGHIVLRAAMLILLGLILGNEDMYDAVATGVPKNIWYMCVPLSALAMWAAWPLPRKWNISIRVVGAAVFLWLLIIFRGQNELKQVVWLQHANSDCQFGILGMIGWGYLTCSLIYLMLRGNRPALMGWLGLMIAAYMGWRHGRLDFLASVSQFVSLGQIFGATAAVVMAGVVVGTLFSGPRKLNPHYRLRFIMGFGALLVAAGYLIRPLHGISKIQMTDAYALVSAGVACLCYGGFYIAMEMAKIRGGFGLLVPVGQNALMAYLLPDIVGRLLELAGLTDIPWAEKGLGPGVTNVALLTLVILFFVRFVTQRRIIVRL